MTLLKNDVESGTRNCRPPFNCLGVGLSRPRCRLHGNRLPENRATHYSFPPSIPNTVREKVIAAIKTERHSEMASDDVAGHRQLDTFLTAAARGNPMLSGGARWSRAGPAQFQRGVFGSRLETHPGGPASAGSPENHIRARESEWSSRSGW